MQAQTGWLEAMYLTVNQNREKSPRYGSNIRQAWIIMGSKLRFHKLSAHSSTALKSIGVATFFRPRYLVKQTRSRLYMRDWRYSSWVRVLLRQDLLATLCY